MKEATFLVAVLTYGQWSVITNPTKAQTGGAQGILATQIGPSADSESIVDK